jgi:hypothetical protein
VHNFRETNKSRRLVLRYLAVNPLFGLTKGWGGPRA